MLLAFRVTNYRSFKNEARISFLATRLDEGAGISTSVAEDGSAIDVLPVAAVLGANASGKSNLLRAMSFMRNAVLESAVRSRREEPLGNPFLLDPQAADQPTLMELDFVLRGIRYQYGFELLRGKFTEEWLLTFPHKRSQTLFDREKSTEYTFGKSLHGQNRTITEITRPEVLFLSAAAQAGHPILSRIYRFFETSLVLLDVPQRSEVSEAVVRRLAERRQKTVQLLSLADLGIIDARIREDTISSQDRQSLRKAIEEQLEDSLPIGKVERELHIDRLIGDFMTSEPTVELTHKSLHRGVPLPFDEESLGTKSWLAFVSYALDALESGGALLVDELDASLHPLLIAEALNMFQDKKSNRSGAQLIFTTHDVTLLDNSFERFRLSRGQVWLAEKGDDGSSSLTPLSDYRPRKGEDLARGYLQGRYGGTPRVPAGSASATRMITRER